MAGELSVKAIDGEHVLLLTSSSKLFEDALRDTRDKAADKLLPFVVLLRNDGDQEIVGYNVVWTCEDYRGRVVTHHFVGFDYQSYLPGRGVKSHAGLFVSLPPGVGVSADISEDEIERQYRFYVSQKRITISLEAILYADGRAAGPDRYGTIPRWKAAINAEKDILTLAQSVADPTQLRQSLVAAEDQAEHGLSPQRGAADKDRAFWVSQLAQTTKKGYDEVYLSKKGYFARRLIEMIDQRGGESALESVKSLLNSKPFPVVHE